MLTRDKADPSHTFLRSSFFEKLVEHVFISEVLQEAWYGLGLVVEVLRSEVDASGFDVVFECGRVVRHVQLKTTRPNAMTQSQKVNIALADKPSGCVVWLMRAEDLQTNRMQLQYRFFGNGAGEGLPSLDTFKIAKHTKGDRTGKRLERPNIRIIPKSQFRPVATTGELVRLLFEIPEAASRNVPQSCAMGRSPLTPALSPTR